MEWTGARYADRPTVEVPIEIDAPPERVWAIVSDIETMPGASAELQAVEWLAPRRRDKTEGDDFPSAATLVRLEPTQPLMPRTV